MYFICTRCDLLCTVLDLHTASHGLRIYFCIPSNQLQVLNKYAEMDEFRVLATFEIKKVFVPWINCYIQKRWIPIGIWHFSDIISHRFIDINWLLFIHVLRTNNVDSCLYGTTFITTYFKFFSYIRYGNLSCSAAGWNWLKINDFLTVSLTRKPW